MPRPERICFAGALYHVTARGNDRAAIVRDDSDRRSLLATLAGAVGKFGWLCHAYCLMDTHYHLVVETPEPNISAGMQRLNGTYAQRFNQRHKRNGHLFQGRFHSALIDREAHLLEVCRYVVLNPVRARMCARPVGWAWSSYRATAGLSARPAFLTISAIHSLFARDTARAILAYRVFVGDAK
jgi:putative transposase